MNSISSFGSISNELCTVKMHEDIAGVHLRASECIKSGKLISECHEIMQLENKNMNIDKSCFEFKRKKKSLTKWHSKENNSKDLL